MPPSLVLHLILKRLQRPWFSEPSTASSLRNEVVKVLRWNDSGKAVHSRRCWKSAETLVAQVVKNPPAMRGMQVHSLGREDPLEKGMATHSSFLAWEILWTEEPGGLQSTWSTGSQKSWLSDWAVTTMFLDMTERLTLWFDLSILSKANSPTVVSVRGPTTARSLFLGLEVKWQSLSRVQLFATPRTIQSMGFSRPEYWSG